MSNLVAVAVLILLNFQSAQTRPVLKLVMTIPLPGVAGRIDHFACDVNGKRLFIAALGNNTVEVVDLDAGKRIHSIPGLKEPQGVAYLPSRQRLFVANGLGEGVDVFDGRSYRKVGSTTIGDDSDNVRVIPGADQLVVGYGSGALAVIGGDGSVLKRIPLRAHPESFQIANSSRLVFVNVPGARKVIIIALDTGRRVAEWDLKEAGANYPMSVDEREHLLSTGCRNPPMVVVFDTETGKPVARLDIVGDTDDIFFDSAHRRLYVIGGGGMVNVFRMDGPTHFSRLGSVSTALGARTGLFVAEFQRLYVAVPRHGAQQAEVRVYGTQP